MPSGPATTGCFTTSADNAWCSRRAAGSAEGVGELAAEPGVLVGELLVAAESGGEPGAQRRVGCPLARRDGTGGAGAACLLPQPADLVADVGLGIEPRS
jgi:hypothetical protein